MKRPAVKKHEVQSCDACSRDFTPVPNRKRHGWNWKCPHCGYDNAVGHEWLYAAEKAADRAADRRKAERKAKAQAAQAPVLA
jgi:DNA-directed RNA polymerase subunit M/transcription elongation factor TFIIS